MSEKTKAAVPFEQHVWNVLSHIEIVDHIDQIPGKGKRPAISYLAWHKAWMLLKRNFPASTYCHKVDQCHPDGSVEVEVDLAISYDGSQTMFSNARLAVMDNYFNAIKNPDARSINDSRQRALVKALAFAGLGLNLWADGSVIPVGKLADPISAKQYDELMDLIEKTETDMEKFLEWCDVEDLIELPFERFGSAFNLLRAKLARMPKEEEAA